MTVRVFEDQGAAELNKAVIVGRVQSVGPVDIVASNLSATGQAVLSFSNQRTGVAILSDKDTARSAEDTTYDGDTSTLVFSGQVLNNLPVVPGSVTVTPTAGGDTVNLTDRDGDGKLYTDDVDEDEAGTIDYFTGALELSFPAGKAPNNTNILCDYTSQDAALTSSGRRTYNINNVLQEDTVVVKAASDQSEGTHVKTDGVATWI